MKVRPSTLPVAVAVSGLLLLALTMGATRQQESISVDHPRPLAEVIRIFQNRYQLVVTYEDPLFTFDDVLDVTEKVRNPAGLPSTHRVYGPRGGPFAVGFPKPQPDSNSAEIIETLGAVVSSYNSTEYPGEFRVVQTEGMFHVIPARSILDCRISLGLQKERTAVDTLSELFLAVKGATGQTIVFGSAPHNLLIQSQTDVEATGEIARDVLARTLRSTGRDLSWRLLYSLDLQQYALNISIVGSH